MTKPSLNTNRTVAVSGKNHAYLFLFGTNLESGIKKNNIDVKYNGLSVEINYAKVRGSVLIIKMKKVTKTKSNKDGDDEIIVIVTNPSGPPPSEPVPIPIVFDEDV